MLQGVYKSQTTKIAHHYQSGSGGYKYIGEGLIANNGSAVNSYRGDYLGWSFDYKKGNPFKLHINRSIGQNSRFYDSEFTDYVPLVIIPHFKLEMSAKYVVDISTLYNENYTCQYPVVLENDTFTATTDYGESFTFNALVVKLDKLYLTPQTTAGRLQYYIPEFDIIFDDLKPKVIADIIDCNFECDCILCTVDINSPNWYHLYNISPATFKSKVSIDLTDYLHYNYYRDYLSREVETGFLGSGYSILLVNHPDFSISKLNSYNILFSVNISGEVSDNGVQASTNYTIGTSSYIRYLTSNNYTGNLLQCGANYISIMELKGQYGSANTNKWEWVRT